jgi:hypothetical protein
MKKPGEKGGQGRVVGNLAFAFIQSHRRRHARAWERVEPTTTPRSRWKASWAAERALQRIPKSHAVSSAPTSQVPCRGLVACRRLVVVGLHLDYIARLDVFDGYRASGGHHFRPGHEADEGVVGHGGFSQVRHDLLLRIVSLIA